MFVLQAHPERFSLFKKPVEKMIQTAIRYGDVWIASLGEISKWWQQRNTFSFEVNKMNKDQYQIVTNGTNRFEFRFIGKKSRDILSVRDSSILEINSKVRPVIGLAPNPSQCLLHFMRQEGYLYEIGHNRRNFACFISNSENFDINDRNDVKQKIEQSVNPIIQYRPWPRGYRCCMAVTGDIDGLDVRDILERYHG